MFRHLSIYLRFLVISWFLLGPLAANAYPFPPNTLETSGKHYVSTEQIFLSAEGIEILYENGILVTQGIFHDDEGFYFLSEGVHWICRNCGALNELDASSCYRCGS